VPPPFLRPPPQNVWNELLYPREWPLSHHELSYLLPHFLMEGRGKLAAYFTRVYQPGLDQSRGMVWEQVLRDESKVELHAALTPTWSETAQYADYVLPMGVGAERHDLMSQETHSAQWISFRQPVIRTVLEKLGKPVEFTHQANPARSGKRTILDLALVAHRPRRIARDPQVLRVALPQGERITVDEYYRWIFENSVPGLPAEAAKLGLTPLEYMRTARRVPGQADTWEAHLKKLDGAALAKRVSATTARCSTTATGRHRRRRCRARRLQHALASLRDLSKTMIDWVGASTRCPVHREPRPPPALRPRQGEYALVPTFRLPTLIHTRSGNSKWLYELSNTNPV